MEYKKATFTLLIIFLFLASIVFILNYSVDPYCQFHCTEIKQNQTYLNPYIINAQRILAYPSTEQIIIGSSRGQTTSPLWVQHKTGLQTLNLSIAGSNIETKKSLIDFAKKNLKLKKIIWYADYYEFGLTRNELSFVNVNQLQKSKLSFELFKNIFNHNTIEATLKALTVKNVTPIPDQGSGSHLKDEDCFKATFDQQLFTQINTKLQAEIDLTFEKYTQNIFKNGFNINQLVEFKSILNKLEALNIEVDVIIPGYHPQFLNKLKISFPRYYNQHLEWINELKLLKSQKIKIFDHFNNLESLNTSDLFWNDGDHFTCRQSAEYLNY